MNIKAALFIFLVILTYLLTACTGSSLLAEPNSTPQPTPTNDPLAAAKVVQAFWSALAAGDLETALVYVDEKIICSGFCHFTGKLTFQSYLQGYLDAGHVTKISDVKNVGNIVTYTWEVYRNGYFLRRGEDDEFMQVENGKIVYWENYHR